MFSDVRGSPGLTWAAVTAIAFAVALALVFVAAVNGDPAEAQESCDGAGLNVPGAERQDEYCLDDLTTEGLQLEGRTNRNDWQGLNASGTENPPGEVAGIQIDGYFPDDTDNGNNNTNNAYNHNAQFVIRLPEDWNGKLVVSGAPGVRGQYANDFIISDYVLSKGYAYASTDKGNVGINFYRDGEEPGDAIAEWHTRVEQLTRATKKVVKQRYEKAPEKTYITGISNGGYLTRYALENTPQLYDGGVDWEGTLFRAEGPNLLTYLPTALANFPEYRATGDREAFRNIVDAGFAADSEFLWNDYYTIYWDLTQRTYREEFDPSYDGAIEAGIPFCQPGTPNCDADYDYEERPQSVKDAIRKVELTGEIGKPMITLHGDIDTLLPIRTDSDVYSRLIKQSGNGKMHRYYEVEEGDHVDSFHDDFPDKVRPILPCHREAFTALEGWIEDGEKPPASGTIERPENGDVVNDCQLPADQNPPDPDPEPNPNPDACTIKGTQRSEVLRGTPGRDVICGLGGNDRISGNGGNDIIRGGDGNDQIYGGDGNDTIYGGDGSDQLNGESGNDDLRGDAGNDDLNGGAGRDRYDGGSGSNRCDSQKNESARRCS